MRVAQLLHPHAINTEPPRPFLSLRQYIFVLSAVQDLKLHKGFKTLLSLLKQITAVREVIDWGKFDLRIAFFFFPLLLVYQYQEVQAGKLCRIEKIPCV